MGPSAMQTLAAAAIFLIFFGILFGCRPEQPSRGDPKATRPASAEAAAKLEQQQQLKEHLLAEIAALDQQLGRLKATATASPAKTQADDRGAAPARAQQDGGGGGDNGDAAVERSVEPWEFVTESVYYLTEASQASITPHVFTSPFAERRLELKTLVSDARRLATAAVAAVPPPPEGQGPGKGAGKGADAPSAADLHYMYGFLRFDGATGLDAEFHFGRAGASASVFALRAARRFSRPVVVGGGEALRAAHAALVHMVVPLAGRLDKLAFFADTLAAVLRAKDAGRVFLTVVYFGEQGLDEARRILAQKLGDDAANAAAADAAPPAYRLLRKSGRFSRGGGLQHGATSPEAWPAALTATARTAATLFFIDVDILFDAGALRRCRWLAERGRRVYYPMVFSQYNPDVAYRHLDAAPPLRERTGHNYTAGFWRSFGFGMACLHYADFNASGGFDLDIEGWGAEDVMLYRKFIAQRKVAVVRAVDRGLFHLFHEKVCDRTLAGEQLRMCQGTKGVNEASPEQMGYLLYK